MKPPRLTRVEKRDRTRECLLTAARAVFLKKGFVAASIEEIAILAGYTRGAFYSNFSDKTELLLELLKRDRDEIDAELRQILEAGEPRDEMQRMALAHYRQHFRRHESFLMWMEAKLQAVRDAQFREHFNAFLRDKQKRMTAYVASLAERTGASLPLPAEVLAVGLMGLCDGVQSCYAVDPQRVTDELADAVLAGFFARAVFDRSPD